MINERTKDLCMLLQAQWLRGERYDPNLLEIFRAEIGKALGYKADWLTVEFIEEALESAARYHTLNISRDKQIEVIDELI